MTSLVKFVKNIKQYEFLGKTSFKKKAPAGELINLFDSKMNLTKYVHLLQRIAVAANEAAVVDDAFKICLDEVCAVTRWPVGHAYMLADDGTGDLVPSKLWHFNNSGNFETFRHVTEATRFAPKVGLPGRVLASGEPLWIIDVTKDANFPRAQLARDIGVKAGFAFPVLIQSETVAVLEFFSAEAIEPDAPLLEVMANVGAQLGRVVERKRAEEALLEQTKYVRLLERIAVAANEAVVVGDAFQVCLDAVCAVTRWPVGHAYMLADDGTGDLVPSKLWHFNNSGNFETFRHVTEATRFAPKVGLPGRVLASGEPLWIIDVTKDANFPRAQLARDIGVKAGFAFPVLVGDGVVAVLEFFSEEAIEPDAPLLEVMAHVGTQLGRVVERKRAEEALRIAHDELEWRVEERTRELKREITARENAESTALEMQVGLLPGDELVAKVQDRHGLEIASYFKPSSTLSGDIWGMKSLDRNRLGVYIVDFSGHGIHAALNTFRIHTLLTQVGVDLGDPSTCMSALNLELIKLLATGQFAAMLCGVIDTSMDTFAYSAAAATHPLVFLPGGRRLIVGDSSGLPLGLMEDASYERRQIHFPPGAALFLYSDALTETRDRKGHRMGAEGLVDRVTDHLVKRSPSDLLTTIIGNFLDSTKGPLTDDLTAISIWRST